MSQALLLNPVQDVTSDQAYKLLTQVIKHTFDRFTGSETYTLELALQPVNGAPWPNLARLMLVKLENQDWSAGLLVGFNVNGQLPLPGNGEPVHWLINGERFASQITHADNRTSRSSGMRIGTDIMPGPLTVWLSAPINRTRTAGVICVDVHEELLQALATASTVELRLGRMEFRAFGPYHFNKKGCFDLSACITGLRAIVEKQPTSSDAWPLLAAIEDENKKNRRKFLFRVAIMIALTLAFLSSPLLLQYMLNDKVQSTPVLNAHPTPAPSPSPAKDGPLKGKSTRRNRNT